MVKSKTYGRVRKFAKSARKIVRGAAKTYMNVVRSPAVRYYRKTGKISTTAIAKSLMDLRRKVGASAEYKLIDDLHTTGSPDVTLRQYYTWQASAVQATVGNTTTPGTFGYFLAPVTNPTRGNGQTNFDGKRYSVESIQWKGSLATVGADATVKLYVVAYSDEDMDPFQMSEFLKVDNNGEYSVNSKLNPDYKGYRIIASRTYRMGNGSNSRKDFNIIARPKKMVKLNESDDAIISTRYFVVGVTSTDIATRTIQVQYVGNTRMRFVH